jgi:phage FluMu protein Com
MKDFNFNCPHCNQLLEASITMMGTIIDCPSCNNSIKIPGPEINYLLRTTEKFGPRQIIAIAGILLLIIGIFAPIAHIPVYGDINYFQNGNVDGIIIIVLAILSFVAIILKEDYLLFFTSLGCIGTLTFSFVRFKLMISKVAANN